jgi:gas vesicle protein
MDKILIGVGVIVAFLLSLLGIERSKNKRKDVKIQQQKQEIVQQKKQTEVYKVAQEAVKEAVEVEKKLDKENVIVQKKIEEAESDEEVIKIANDLINSFNSKRN